jgi:hypothetical protein
MEDLPSTVWIGSDGKHASFSRLALRLFQRRQFGATRPDTTWATPGNAAEPIPVRAAGRLLPRLGLSDAVGCEVA